MAAPTQIGLTNFPAAHADRAVMRYFFFVIAAGLLNSFIAAFFFLRLPSTERPTLNSLILRAAIFVVAGGFAGTLGCWYYWRRRESPFHTQPPISFRLFALSAAAGWLFVPAIVLFSREDSPLTAAIALCAAAILAASLRSVIPSALSPTLASSEEKTLFASTLATPPRQFYGYILSFSIYAAGYDLSNGWVLDASGMLAFSAFFFFWMLTQGPSSSADPRRQSRRAAIRLALLMVSAFLVTLFSLLHGIEHRARLDAIAIARAVTQPSPGAPQQPTQPASPSGAGGYQSIILWPIPAKTDLIPPIPVQTNLLSPGTTEPLTLRFNGQYWYYQPPNQHPSPTAHQANGTPLAIDIRSNNFIRLIMEAHQTLSASIPVARCRQLKVDTLNRDNLRGTINVAVLLTDSTQPTDQIYLGQQPILTTLPANFSVKSTAAAETLTFNVPQQAKVRRFDQITVMFLPEDRNEDTAPKVAIDEFHLIPR